MIAVTEAHDPLNNAWDATRPLQGFSQPAHSQLPQFDPNYLLYDKKQNNNNLPNDITSASSMGVFESPLECHLFSISFCSTLLYSANTVISCHFGHFNHSCYLLNYFKSDCICRDTFLLQFLFKIMDSHDVLALILKISAIINICNPRYSFLLHSPFTLFKNLN